MCNCAHCCSWSVYKGFRFTKRPLRFWVSKFSFGQPSFWADILSLSNYMPNSINIAVGPSSHVAFMGGGGESVSDDFFVTRYTFWHPIPVEFLLLKKKGSLEFLGRFIPFMRWRLSRLTQWLLHLGRAPRASSSKWIPENDLLFNDHISKHIYNLLLIISWFPSCMYVCIYLLRGFIPLRSPSGSRRLTTIIKQWQPC